MKRVTIAALGVAGLLAAAGDAHAAGIYVTDRGVRPLGRGGAFVAGADDLGALWDNPAGIAGAGGSILVDASWLNFSSDYTRRTQVVSSSGAVSVDTFPTTHGTSPVLPIPTLGGSYA